jgi:two-component system response regulator YesN
MSFIDLYKDNRKRNKIFFLLAIQYILVILLPLISVFYIYQRSMTTIENNIIERNLLALKKSSNNVEQLMLQTEMMAQQLSNNVRVLKYKNINFPFDGKNIIRASELNKDLMNYISVNSLINNFYIIFKDNGSIIGPTSVSKVDNFYSVCFSYDDITYEQWFSEWVNYDNNKSTLLPSRKINLTQKKDNVVTVIFPLIDYVKYQDINIVFLIKNTEVTKYLHGSDNIKNGFGLILDKNNQLISSTIDISGNDDIFRHVLQNISDIEEESGTLLFKINNERIILTYVVSDTTELKYLFIQPFKGILSDSIYIKKIFLLLFLFTIVFETLIIWIFVSMNGKPIKVILGSSLEIMSKEAERCSTFDLIQKTFLKLKYNYHSLVDLFDSQKPLMQASFFEKLLRGGFIDHKEIDLISNQIGIYLNSERYTVAIVKLSDCPNGFKDNPSENFYMKKALFKKIISEFPITDRKLFLHEMDINTFAIIIATQGKSSSEIEMNEKALIDDIDLTLRNKTDFPFVIFVGEPCYDPLEISASMDSARQCMNFTSVDFDEKGVVWYDNSILISPVYLFSHETENRLINYILSDNFEETNRLLKDIFYENIIKRKISLSLLKLLANELCGALYRALNMFQIDETINIYQEINKTLDFIENAKLHETIEDAVERLYNDFLNYLTDFRDHNNNIAKKIVEYLNENYHCPDITLVSVADIFKISQAHLSKIFKDYSGFTVYSYLEKVRMEKACDLLARTDDSVNKVILRIGYLSMNTFCRAFKRYHGLTTSQYRKITNSRT